MRIKSIPASWLEQEDLRLDCGPYMSGALEATEKLEGLEHIQPLKASFPFSVISLSHAGRVSTPPKEKRRLGRNPALPLAIGYSICLKRPKNFGLVFC